VRWTFKGLWEVSADDAGRFVADARIIKGQLWPLDDDITAKKIEAYLKQLAERGRISLYAVAGVRYGVVVNFLKHQKISHPTPSRLPAPPESHDDLGGNGARNSPEPPQNDSGDARESFRPDRDVDLDRDVDVDKDGILNGGRFRKSAGAVPDRSRDQNSPTEKRLPEPALDILAKMPAERRPDGERQLWAALEDPDGAKIRRGEYAKAQNVAHLEYACRHALKRLPNDRGLCVLWVLRKLAEPWVATDANGRTVTEAAAETGKQERAADERERAQRIADAESWANANVEECAEIEYRLTQQYPDRHRDLIQASAYRMALVSAKIAAAEGAHA
jgi:hypothetical protein